MISWKTLRLPALALALAMLCLPALAQGRHPAMVAAAHPLAAEAGTQILEAGGTAVDAAVAVQAVLGLVEPQSSGIGGGAFLLYYDAESGQTYAYDGRETAPAAADETLFLDANGQPLPFFQAGIGGRAVGVPGVIAMLEMAHAAHGALPWGDLFQSAIRLSKDGFKLSERYAQSVDRMARVLTQVPATARYFLDDQGRALPAGHLQKNPEYAHTLTLIAEGGARAFYTGPIAKAIVEAVTNPATNPGRMTLEDLAGYKAVARQALCRPYREDTVCTMPPPTSGGVTSLQILGMLEHFDLATMEPGGAGLAHLFTEASRLAYADRAAYIGDPAFVAVPVEGMLDRDYLASRARLIDPARAMARVSAGTPPGSTPHPPAVAPEGQHTTHFSIVDHEGNVLAMTSSVQIPYGSGLMAAGFILNNELTDFETVPRQNGVPVANRPEGGKRPRSSMDPTIVFDADNRPILTIGSPGGARIIGYVTQALIGYLDSGLPLDEALAQPHVNSTTDAVTLETGTPAVELKEPLEALGHKVQIRDMDSGLQAIALDYEGDTVTLTGAADPRREGVALEAP